MTLHLRFDEGMYEFESWPLVGFHASTFQHEEFVHFLLEAGIGNRPRHKFVEFDWNDPQIILDPIHREQWPQHIEIFFSPDDIALQIGTKVAVCHSQLVVVGGDRVV